MADGNHLEKRKDGSIICSKMANKNIPEKASENGPILKRIGREFLYIHL